MLPHVAHTVHLPLTATYVIMLLVLALVALSRVFSRVVSSIAGVSVCTQVGNT